MTVCPQLQAPDPQQLRDKVFAWLCAVPTDDARAVGELGRTLKRRRLRRRLRSSSPTSLYSPPLTADCTMPPLGHDSTRTPTGNKRRRRWVEGPGEDHENIDATPRPPQTSGIASASSSASNLTRPSQLSAASASWKSASWKSSSPTKQMNALAMRSDGIETRTLRVEVGGLHPALAELVRTLKRVHNGKKIISADVEAAIAAEAKHNRAFEDDFDEAVFAPAPERDRLGPTPRVEDVRGVYKWATVTDELRAGEDSWNLNVHGPLLKMALHGGHEHKDVLVDFQSCINTPLIASYLPPQANSKRVDFVMMVINAQHDRTGQGDAAARSINTIRGGLPENSINHCSDEALWQRPVAVSVETKKSGVSERDAELQVGTWLAAQFRLLRKLTGADDDDDAVSFVEGSGGNAVATATALPKSMQDLPFLPAIIVHRHDWKFAAATQEGEKTVLWRDQPFGSTRDVLGVFKIVAGIQHIARYVEEVYWPWYKVAVLGLKG